MLFLLNAHWTAGLSGGASKCFANSAYTHKNKTDFTSFTFGLYVGYKFNITSKMYITPTLGFDLTTPRHFIDADKTKEMQGKRVNVNTTIKSKYFSSSSNHFEIVTEAGNRLSIMHINLATKIGYQVTENLSVYGIIGAALSGYIKELYINNNIPMSGEHKSDYGLSGVIGAGVSYGAPKGRIFLELKSNHKFGADAIHNPRLLVGIAGD